MDYRKKIKGYDGDLSFQALEWVEGDDGDPINDDINEYQIKVFGVSEEGHSVGLTINSYRPTLYVRIPPEWNKTQITVFYDEFKKKLVDYSKELDYTECLVGLELEKAQDYYGFKGGKKDKFLKLVFNNSSACKMAKNRITYNLQLPSFSKNELKQLKTYETPLPHFIRFCHTKNIQLSGWLKLEYGMYELSDTTDTKCQLNAVCEWEDVEPLVKQTNAPILQASYDIEAYSVDGSFPSPEVNDNQITMIATCFKVFGADDFLFKHVITLKDCAPIDTPGVIVESYETEEEVLLAWAELIKKMDPDVLYAYNSDWFDGHYIITRCKNLKISNVFCSTISRLTTEKASIKEDRFSSSAYGESLYRRFLIPGRISFDILIYIQREFQEVSYKLDDISYKYLGQNKNPVTPQQIFSYFEEGTPEKIKTVAEYCITDTVLPQLLVDKFHILQNQISMSNVTYVPIKFLIYKGQQIKVFSQILRLTSRMGYRVPDTKISDKDEDENGKFKGATVLTPECGGFWTAITTLDFASLYPSIIRAHNLDYSTFVMDSAYDNIEGYDYLTVDWEDESGRHCYKYVQNKEGVLPKLLEELAKSRKDAKKKMAEATNSFERAIYDKLQLAYKVSMNSVYGFLAAHMLRCKPIAATVTTIGRRMIDHTKKSVEAKYDASVCIYGDSVPEDEPVITKNAYTGQIEVKEIGSVGCRKVWELFPQFKAFDEAFSRTFKQQQTVENTLVWANGQWTKLHRVIRHKCNKRLYRITTDKGQVTVTEDHSLIGPGGQLIKPGDLQEGSVLYYSRP
jgi:DNA polymerase delta subunit 1